MPSKPRPQRAEVVRGHDSYIVVESALDSGDAQPLGERMPFEVWLTCAENDVAGLTCKEALFCQCRRSADGAATLKRYVRGFNERHVAQADCDMRNEPLLWTSEGYLRAGVSLPAKPQRPGPMQPGRVLPVPLYWTYADFRDGRCAKGDIGKPSGRFLDEDVPF